MKKNLFFLAAATFALASCSNEDVIELNEGNAIDFRAAMGVASRGAETTSDNIGQFYVTAIDVDANNANYFTDVLFTKGSGNLFTSASEYFWPSTHTLNFYAYSYYTGKKSENKLNDIDLNKLGTISITSEGQTLSGFSPATTVADQIDFVSAVKSASKAENSGIGLEFQHNLVQAEVKGYTDNTNYTFEIKGVKFGNLKSKGTFNFADSEWTLTEDKADYVIEYENAKTLNSTVDDLSDLATVQHMMVLPQETAAGDMKADKANVNKGAYIAVKLKITIKHNGTDKTQVYPYADSKEDYEWAYIPVDIDWERGNCYVYTLNFSRGAGYDENGDPILGEPISFTAKVTDWVNKTMSEENMHVPAVDKTTTTE